MGKLCVKLVPFAPDYSGVCSALFDLNCIAVLHDASGCTGNYVGFDEPRWYGSQSATFCSGLREIDAVLGDDEKLIQKVMQASASLRPDLIALVGSPVPMVIGTDFEGIAADLESRTGLPCVGFDTTGTQYYPVGVAKACIALAQRFTRPPERKRPLGVNLLGVTPLDFGTEASENLRSLLAANGLELVADFCDGLTLDAVGHASEASLNLVVSLAGLEPARWLHEKYGTPFLVGAPIGEKAQALWLEEVFRRLHSQEPGVMPACGGDAETLVLGDAVLCRSWQFGLQTEFGVSADCGCLFGTDPLLAGKHELNLASEDDIGRAVNSGRYRTVIGDPMFRSLIRPGSGIAFLDVPAYCVSSKTAGMPPCNPVGAGLNHLCEGAFAPLRSTV